MTTSTSYALLGIICFLYFGNAIDGLATLNWVGYTAGKGLYFNNNYTITLYLFYPIK